jgi:hypothetical protein
MKKYFLDDQRAENVTNDELNNMKLFVQESLDFAQPISLLKRKGDLISKIYAKQDKNEELLGELLQWANNENSNARLFAMYLFEVLSDVHLTEEQLIKHKDALMMVFSKSFQDDDVKVRVAALKACTCFMTSIDDSDVAMTFKPVVPTLLSTVVEALKTDEDQGKMALSSMDELTQVHCELWKGQETQIITICSEIMSRSEFENGTRAVAYEIVSSLTQSIPASIRKTEVVKTLLFPTFFRMMAEMDDDVEEWQN